jgi:lysophospholipase L1-like esterase
MANDSLDRRPAHGWRHALKIGLVCLLLVVALLALAESVVRVCGFDRPLAGAVAFAAGADDDPIHQTDSLLFYSLRPDVHTMWQGADVNTNRLGLRGPGIGPKQANEFRILCLGESSTFGAGVEDDETYSARLEAELQSRDEQHAYRVINAGVSGYSSFQSLKYFESRGLDLEPDLVLFYHEINDYLPAGYSDRELFESRIQAWHRGLAEWSAVYRAISGHIAARKIAAQRVAGPPQQAGAVPPDAMPLLPEGLETPVGRVRVSADERRLVFQELVDLCRKHGITLVFIHPSYAESTRHACELTEFCEQGGHALYEAHDSLHPPGTRPRACFLDECHPNAEGHHALAVGLCDFLAEIHAVPFNE